jgi:hypothetical protein
MITLRIFRCMPEFFSNHRASQGAAMVQKVVLRMVIFAVCPAAGPTTIQHDMRQSPAAGVCTARQEGEAGNMTGRLHAVAGKGAIVASKSGPRG